MQRSTRLFFFTLACLAGPLYQLYRVHGAVDGDPVVFRAILQCITVSFLGYLVAYWLIGATKDRFKRKGPIYIRPSGEPAPYSSIPSPPPRPAPLLPQRPSSPITRSRGLSGIDLNKAPPKSDVAPIVIPEALGLTVGCVFLLCVVSFQLLYTHTLHGHWHRLGATFDASWLVEYNGGLASICFMIMLGFADDVLDIPWRVKLLLPAFAAVPLLIGYSGHTAILVPRPLRGLLVWGYGRLDMMLELGFLYKVPAPRPYIPTETKRGDETRKRLQQAN